MTRAKNELVSLEEEKEDTRDIVDVPAAEDDLNVMSTGKDMEFRVIDLEWEGRFEITYDREEDEYLLDKVPEALLNEHGFYQIYGRHPTYGKDVLLYIGETKKNENGTRSFKTRLEEHLKQRFFNYTNLSISLAPSNEDSETIKEAESVLIAAHKPALNRQHIDTHKKCRKPILIRNWSFVGSLNECCTSFWDEVDL